METAAEKTTRPKTDEAAAEGLPAGVGALGFVDRALAKIEEVLLVLSLAALIGLGAYQAIVRNFFGGTPVWIDEVIRYSVFFIGLMGAALAAQSDRLINIDMLTRLFSPRARIVIRIMTAAFTIYVCWMLVKSSMVIHKTMAGEEGEIIAPGHAWLSLPLACGLISAHLAIHSVMDLLYLAAGKLPPTSDAPKE